MTLALVTGSAGFLGSHVVDELLKRRYHVREFDIWANPSQDIRNPWAVADAVKGVDAVFHLAAEPYIPYGYQNPELFLDTNVTGTLNVLNAARRNEAPRVMYWSTSEVYGTWMRSEWLDSARGMTEEHPTNPHSTYAVTKLAADRLCWTFHKEHGLPVTIIRQFNAYGPRESQPYVIPTIIEQLAEGPELRLGNMNVARDFTYAADAARAAVDLYECGEAVGQIVNVGTGRAWTVERVAFMLREIMRPGETIRAETDPGKLRPYDVDVLQCDPSKLERLTGWEPEYALSDGLGETVKWFRENRSKWDYRGKR